MLIETEKQSRVDWYRKMRQRFENGRSKLVSEIRIYQYDSKRKRLILALFCVGT